MKIENLIEKLQNFSDLSLQESWDNSGIQILLGNNDISNIVISLDITEEVVDFAIKKNANLIISHHPLIFSGIKSINFKKTNEKIIIKAIKHNINILSFHTNIDKSINGLADFFCQKLKLTNTKPLSSMNYEKVFKIVTFIPENFLEKFLNFFSENNISIIGEYKACSFYTKGTGTFYPLEKSSPFSGEKGKLNKVNELRIEIQSSEKRVQEDLKNIRNLHPYEEPVIDIYKLLQNENLKGALGRIGSFQSPIKLIKLIEILKNNFNINTVKVSNFNENLNVQKIAVCPGSGMSLLNDALKSKSDVFITGDVKYHEALDAKEKGLTIIDIGHYSSEFIFTELISKFLKEACNIDTLIFPQKDIFKYL